MNSQIQVVSCETIPPIREVEVGGEIHTLGELRDFRWSDTLREFMPDASVCSISWVQLGHKEVLDEHSHPIQSMMVIHAGTGEMFGDLRQSLRAGDVIVVPAGCKHGFVGGPETLCALSIQFGEGLYTAPERPRVEFSHPTPNECLEDLLEYNKECLKEFAQRPIFALLTDGTLENPVKRATYFKYLQIWVDGNQKLLFSRQASCSNPSYERMFLQHMHEEMGHEKLHTETGDSQPTALEANQPAWDPVLAAVTNWFAYQMFVLDDAEKTALIHLVIENGSELYHQRAMPVLGKYIKNDYFEVHVGADADHAEMGIAMLGNESPAAYARMRQIVGEGWKMVGAMTDRVVELTRSA